MQSSASGSRPCVARRASQKANNPVAMYDLEPKFPGRGSAHITIDLIDDDVDGDHDDDASLMLVLKSVQIILDITNATPARKGM